MKILHTADWHIGQLFHEYDRSYEHQQFLDWLASTIQREQTDVLLISGDVFDLSNPAAASVKMFYRFLNQAMVANPNIQVVITAGNHDSPSRLESPKPLLESSNIHIIGMVERNKDGTFNNEKLIIPLKNEQGETEVWCLAVPFLRMGDYPVRSDCTDPYAEGVAAIYQHVYERALTSKEAGQCIIAMGHLHSLGAEISEHDTKERLIMGGVECVPSTAFSGDLQYVALGHIHKAQKVGGKEHIRYCGSPIPMSFSEIKYKHQIISVEIKEGKISSLTPIEVPVAVPLIRIPAIHKPLHEVLLALDRLSATDTTPELAPYLEVRVLLTGPEPALRHTIETALTGKQVRLAKIDVKYPDSHAGEDSMELIMDDKLDELEPLEVFSNVYEAKYHAAVPDEMLSLFNQVAQEVMQKEE